MELLRCLAGIHIHEMLHSGTISDAPCTSNTRYLKEFSTAAGIGRAATSCTGSRVQTCLALVTCFTVLQGIMN